MGSGSLADNVARLGTGVQIAKVALQEKMQNGLQKNTTSARNAVQEWMVKKAAGTDDSPCCFFLIDGGGCFCKIAGEDDVFQPSAGRHFCVESPEGSGLIVGENRRVEGFDECDFFCCKAYGFDFPCEFGVEIAFDFCHFVLLLSDPAPGGAGVGSY